MDKPSKQSSNGEAVARSVGLAGVDFGRLLTDPNCVHANILRGVLPLTRMQALHIAGATDYDTLKGHLPDVVKCRSMRKPLTEAEKAARYDRMMAHAKKNAPKRAAWNKAHPEVMRASQRKYREKHGGSHNQVANKNSQTNVTKTHARWTKDEDIELLTSKLTNLELAAKLRRSLISVQARKRVLKTRRQPAKTKSCHDRRL